MHIAGPHCCSPVQDANLHMLRCSEFSTMTRVRADGSVVTGVRVCARSSPCESESLFAGLRARRVASV